MTRRQVKDRVGEDTVISNILGAIRNSPHLKNKLHQALINSLHQWYFLADNFSSVSKDSEPLEIHMIKLTFAVTVALLVGCATKSNSGSKDNSASQAAAQEAGAESDLTPSVEWKGVCRKALDEAGQTKKSVSAERLQSSYTFKDKAIVWSVSSFADKDCKDVIDVNKYSFSCHSSPLSSYAQCIQKKWETGDGKTWKEKPMVDYSGTTSRLEMKYSFTALKDNKATLKSIGESEEEESEILFHE